MTGLRTRSRHLLWLAALSACTSPDNAMLEVRMDLPLRVDAMGTELLFARVAVVGSHVAIDPSKPFDFPSESFALTKRDADGCNVNLSIEAKAPHKDRRLLERGKAHELAMLIWFCPSTEACDSQSAPRWLVDFDRAFFPGERSFFEAAPTGSTCSDWVVPASTLPAQQKPGATTDGFDFSLRVDRCEVLGCLDEASQPAQDVGFCREDGVHPCE